MASSWFSLQVKNKLSKSHFTQEDIANLLGVTRVTVSNYATGEATPPLKKAVALAKILGIDLMKMPIGGDNVEAD